MPSLSCAANDILHAEFIAASAAALAADPGLAIAYADRALFGHRLAEWEAAMRSQRATAGAAAPAHGIDRAALRRPRSETTAEQLDVGSDRFRRPRCCAPRRSPTPAGCPSRRGRWDHGGLHQRLLWAGWRATRLPRALVGVRLLERDELSEAMLLGGVLSRLGSADRSIEALAAQRDAALWPG